MGDKYAVDNESAGKVATDARALLPDLETLKTTVTGPLSDAEGALPPEFSTAIGRLKTLRENHERDIKRVKTYATSCVDALDACLTTYEGASAEMVAQQKETERKVVFEHGTAFTNAEAGLNDWANGKGSDGAEDRGIASVNKGMPSSSEGSSSKHSYESTRAHDGSYDSTTSSHSSTSKGYSTASSSTYTYDGRGTTTTSEQTYRASSTHHGVTDTTTYYSGTSFQGNGYNEAHASGQSYTVSRGGEQQYSVQTGEMQVPVR